MRALGERDGAVEKTGGKRDDRPAPRRVVGARRRRLAGAFDDVSPVQGVIEAAPARIRRVQGETRIADRNDELRAGHGRDFGVDIAGLDREGLAALREVADIHQELPVVRRVEFVAGMLGVVLVYPGLQRVALGQ